MTEPLAQARALLEHFKTTVLLDSELACYGSEFGLSIQVVERYAVGVWVAQKGSGLWVGVSANQLPTGIGPDELARVGGMLIQISNLVRQIRALAGGNASDSSRSQTAV